MKLTLFILAVLTIIGYFLVNKFGAENYQFEIGGNNSYQEAQEITAPETLQYVYGSLSAGQDNTDYYALTFKKYTPQVSVKLLISQDSPERFRPNLIFIDPSSLRLLGGQLPFSVPQTLGGRVFEWKNLPQVKQENQSAGEKFWVGPQFVKDMTDAHYTLAVFDPQGKGGKYTLYIGANKPNNDFSQKLNSFMAYLRIKLSLY